LEEPAALPPRYPAFIPPGETVVCATHKYVKIRQQTKGTKGTS